MEKAGWQYGDHQTLFRASLCLTVPSAERHERSISPMFRLRETPAEGTRQEDAAKGAQQDIRRGNHESRPAQPLSLLLPTKVPKLRD